MLAAVYLLAVVGSRLAAALGETVRRLVNGHRQVCVVMDAPTLKYSVPFARAMALRRHIDDDFLSMSAPMRTRSSRYSIAKY